MEKVTVKSEICKGCGLCVEVCPKKIIVFAKETNKKGHIPVLITDESKCIACAFCAMMCPDCALKVEK